MKFKDKSIVGALDLSYKEVSGHVLAVLQNHANRIKKDFEATTKTWKDHHPVFHKKLRFAGGKISIEVWTDDEVWGYLNEGTDRRWALMSHDFMPKTVPRQLTSYAGAGTVLYRGPAEMKAAGIGWAQPGIEPREWTKTVIDLYSPEIMNDLRIAVRTGTSLALGRGR